MSLTHMHFIEIIIFSKISHFWPTIQKVWNILISLKWKINEIPLNIKYNLADNTRNYSKTETPSCLSNNNVILDYSNDIIMMEIDLPHNTEKIFACCRINNYIINDENNVQSKPDCLRGQDYSIIYEIDVRNNLEIIFVSTHLDSLMHCTNYTRLFIYRKTTLCCISLIIMMMLTVIFHFSIIDQNTSIFRMKIKRHDHKFNSFHKTKRREYENII